VNFLLVTPVGDIEPFLALGAALRAAGHRATLLAAPRHQTTAAQAQLAFAPLASAGDGKTGHEVSAQIPATAGEAEQLEIFYQSLVPVFGDLLDAVIARLPAHDTLVYSQLFPFLKNAARKAGRKSAALVFCPNKVPFANLGPADTPEPPAQAPNFFRRRQIAVAWWNAQSQLDAVVNRHAGEALRARQLGRFRGFLRDPGDRALIAVSPALFPPPGMLPEKYAGTGFLRWDAPVTEQTAALARVVAVERTGQPLPVLALNLAKEDFVRLLAAWPRGAPLVVLTDDANFADAPPRPEVICVGGVPRELLFSLAAVVIHDGDSAITAAALHAGRPQIIIPQLVDQLYWARTCKKLGVAKILPRAGWPEALPAALAEVLRDATLPRRAVECATLIRAENGAAQAVRELEKL